MSTVGVIGTGTMGAGIAQVATVAGWTVRLMDKDATLAARAVEGINGSDAESYNVGTGVGQSVFDVIKACRDVTGHAIPHEVTPRRPGDPPMLYANPAKLKRRYSWNPAYGTIASTVETAWRWHNAHPNGFE